MATVPIGVGMGQNIKSPSFLAPTVQVRGAAGRLRSAMIAANDTGPVLALVAQGTAAPPDSDEADQAEDRPHEEKPGEPGGDGSSGAEAAGGFGGVEQVGPDLTRGEEEAAIEGGWGD